VVEEMLFGDVADAAEPDIVTCYDIERSLTAVGLSCIAGVDEVGRGAWAGPVTVCAVIVRPGFPAPPSGLTDSKLLSATRREAIAGELTGWVVLPG
jgi:ribonuclease HII